MPSDQPAAGLDVTAYQPPWKSLTEFALTHDLDRLDPTTPQYQHMIQQVGVRGGRGRWVKLKVKCVRML